MQLQDVRYARRRSTSADRLEKRPHLRDTSPMSIATIRNEILGLSPDERAKLIDLIWDSLSAPEIKARETAWAAESERRIDAFDAGKVGARDAKDVLTDLRNSLRK
jgi:putative addiction module component (TIGR02574 family)